MEKAIKQRPVIEAVQAIMSEVGSVEKRGNNSFHNYSYATAADVLHKLQPLMAKAGLVVFQHQKTLTMLGDGSAMAIEYEFTLAHSSGDIWEEKPVHTGVATAKNSKGGFDDKAANKCHTAARKYFLLALFQIPTGDYADADADSDAPQTKPEAPKQQAPKPQPAKPVANGKAGELYLVNPHGGEVETFTRMSDWLTKLESRLNNSDDPLGWYDQNAATFNTLQGKLANSKPGLEHCKRIVDLVQQIQKAATEPVNSVPDYSSAA